MRSKELRSQDVSLSLILSRFQMSRYLDIYAINQTTRLLDIKNIGCLCCRVQTDAELAVAVHGEKGKVEVAVVEEQDVEDYPVSRSCVLYA